MLCRARRRARRRHSLCPADKPRWHRSSPRGRESHCTPAPPCTLRRSRRRTHTPPRAPCNRRMLLRAGRTPFGHCQQDIDWQRSIRRTFPRHTASRIAARRKPARSPHTTDTPDPRCRTRSNRSPDSRGPFGNIRGNWPRRTRSPGCYRRGAPRRRPETPRRCSLGTPAPTSRTRLVGRRSGSAHSRRSNPPGRWPRCRHPPPYRTPSRRRTEHRCSRLSSCQSRRPRTRAGWIPSCRRTRRREAKRQKRRREHSQGELVGAFREFSSAGRSSGAMRVTARSTRYPRPAATRHSCPGTLPDCRKPRARPGLSRGTRSPWRRPNTFPLGPACRTAR